MKGSCTAGDRVENKALLAGNDTFKEDWRKTDVRNPRIGAGNDRSGVMSVKSEAGTKLFCGP